MPRKKKLKKTISAQHARIAKLETNIRILIDKPDSAEAITIRMLHKVDKMLEHAGWFGNTKL